MDKSKAKQFYSFDPQRAVLAVMGGSQGSAPFNSHFQKYFRNYTESNVQILWQCGKNEYSHLEELNSYKDVHIIPFTNNMNEFYSAADVIVSRSGALALSEMALLGKAMVLIPFPHAAGDHQTRNAETFSNAGAALLISQKLLDKGLLEQSILDLIDNPNKITTMEETSREMGTPNATENITAAIMDIAES